MIVPFDALTAGSAIGPTEAECAACGAKVRRIIHVIIPPGRGEPTWEIRAAAHHTKTPDWLMAEHEYCSAACLRKGPKPAQSKANTA